MSNGKSESVPFFEQARVKCSGCDQIVHVGYQGDEKTGTPAILHPLPYCLHYANTEFFDYLQSLRMQS
jgi:hypothetical protein